MGGQAYRQADMHAGGERTEKWWAAWIAASSFSEMRAGRALELLPGVALLLHVRHCGRGRFASSTLAPACCLTTTGAAALSPHRRAKPGILRIPTAPNPCAPRPPRALRMSPSQLQLEYGYRASG